MNQQVLFTGYGPQLLIVDSADFDGTNDYMTRGAGLTGAADSKSGIVSAWVRKDGGDAADHDLLVQTSSVGGAAALNYCILTSGNFFQVVMRNAADTIILNIVSTATILAGAAWRHVLASWNLGTSARHIYIDDVSGLTQNTLTDDTIDYTRADTAVGAAANGGAKTNGCLAELYFAPGQYLDFSIVANRRKFISSSGKPVYLGADGSSPTGTAPIIYQRVADGAAVATFATNLGTGGDFSITGTLDTGSSSPSD